MPIDNSYISPGIGRVFYSHRKPYQIQKIDVSPESLNLFSLFIEYLNNIQQDQREDIKFWVQDNIRDQFEYYNEFLTLSISHDIKEKFLNIKKTDRKRFLFLVAKYFRLL